ncbi:hypothetical protein L6452_04048 [Arctium lappa]|uniref:Uncharacterized protein n=1 Tax=Arctium lappa TaxID=4217 RepID=A0ACB9FNC0_ARCLA|nr:hypothetical protein L6452_04048 [Arctium lappa]
MNSTPFPLQSLFNPSPKSPISSFPPPPLLKFNKTHFKISPISIRNPTKAAASAAAAATASGGCIPAAEEETLYDLLGISETGTVSEIKKAYKQMALKYHPDVSPPERAEEYTVRFIRVREAYETLSDPEARSVYDRCMVKGLRVSLSGKKGTRFDPGSDGKRRWKETWEGQISELVRRSRVKPEKVDPDWGMSWAARIRKQRSKSGVNRSDQNQ